MKTVPKLVVGNWKMFGRLSSNKALIESLLLEPSVNREQVVIAPPYPYLAQVATLLEGQKLQLGAQNVGRFAENGPYTGKVSAGMLADIGCRYVIVGHSERRAAFSETQMVLSDKIIHAQAAGITPVFCIGETLQERQSSEYLAVLYEQLESIRHSSPQPLVVAYEPIWAIGTGQVAQVEQIAEVHTKIKEWLLLNRPDSANISILYGGSVKADNVAQIFATPNVDGALVGGASLDLNSFTKICAEALL